MKFRIAQITDLHFDEAFPKKHGIKPIDRFERVLSHIKDQGISDIICTGDIGEDKTLPFFFEKLKHYNLSITLGNHDTYKTVSEYLPEGKHQTTQKFYSSTQRDKFKFIYLDSSSGSIDHTQLSWLERELDTSLTIVIFMHHPIIGLNLMVDEIGKLKNRELVLALLASSNKAITIFCGHYHMEDHRSHKNINQYITPAISFQIEKRTDAIVIDSGTFGYRIITFNQGEISSEVKTFHAK